MERASAFGSAAVEATNLAEDAHADTDLSIAVQFDKIRPGGSLTFVSVMESTLWGRGWRFGLQIWATQALLPSIEMSLLYLIGMQPFSSVFL